MKAYKISCRDSEHRQNVVFADNPSSARHQDDRDCDCEFIEIVIRRAKAFDHLAPGPVTVQGYFDQGWHYFCRQCSKDLYGDAGEVIVGDSVYCNRECVVAERQTYHGEDTHSSIVALCKELDEWLRSDASEQ